MKKLLFLAVALYFMVEAKCVGVAIRIVDETGASVPEAEILVSFSSFSNKSHARSIGRSNEDGRFFAKESADRNILIRVEKAGHYSAFYDRIPPANDIDMTVVLPRILSPTALYVSRFDMGSGRSLKIPVADEWMGFDFLKDDWVPPYGKGEVPDLLFRFTNRFLGYKDLIIRQLDAEMELSKKIYARRGEEWSEEIFKLHYGNWDSDLEISFPAEKEGILKSSSFLRYSMLRLPHRAPDEGYEPSWKYSLNNYSPAGFRDDIGFFLRTRVELDESGEIVSANYSKIMGDIRFNARGELMFWYFFNPVPNDRNLEFDTEKNLFPKGQSGNILP